MISGDDEAADGDDADDKEAVGEASEAEKEAGRGCSSTDAVELSDERDECVDEAGDAAAAIASGLPLTALTSMD